MDDTVVTEAPLEIRLGDVPIAVVMRTPGDDRHLSRVRPHRGDPARPGGTGRGEGAWRDPNRWEIVLAEGVVVDPEQFRRNLYASSSCGVCGKASIDAVRITARPLPEGPSIEAAVLSGLPGRMGEAQDAFRRTGGIHAAAAFTPNGELLEHRRGHRAPQRRRQARRAASRQPLADRRSGHGGVGPRRVRDRPEGGGRRDTRWWRGSRLPRRCRPNSARSWA